MADLLYEKHGAVGVLTLNRPDRLNAISGPMLRDFSRQLQEADRDRDVRVLVITGAGKGFCAGLDLKDMAAGKGLNVSDGGGSGPGEFDLQNSPPVVLHNVDTPTICALNGAAAGYGMDLAVGCDIRIAAESSKLAAAFTKRGVLPESGGTWLLPRLVGWAKAAEIAFTGATLSAKECLDLGLVNSVVPDASLMDETMDLAGRIAANAPLAVRATKRMMRSAMQETFEDNVHHVFLQLLPLFQSKDFVEGMTVFMERRPPDFQGR